MTSLQLLISTIDDGIKLVGEILLAPRQGVSYVVSWQITGGMTIADCPQELLMRPDVKVATMHNRGLSRNRNNTIALANADICLICDDDCRYTPEQLDEVVSKFETDPSLDIATFKMADNGTSKKTYPTATTILGSRLPRNYYASSVEIAFRLKSVRGKVEFNEEFGLGSETLWCGEEELFLHEAIERGLKCVFFPMVAVTTNKPTTGTTRCTLPQVLMGRGAFMKAAYPFTCHMRAVKIAHRLHNKTGMPTWQCIRHMFNGMSYYQKLKKSKKPQHRKSRL